MGKSVRDMGGEEISETLLVRPELRETEEASCK